MGAISAAQPATDLYHSFRESNSLWSLVSVGQRRRFVPGHLVTGIPCLDYASATSMLTLKIND